MKKIMLIFIICLYFVIQIHWINGESSETQFQSDQNIFHNSGTVMLIIEVSSGNILDANVAASKFYGYSVEELTQMSIDQINTLTPEEIKAERSLASAEKRNYFIFKHKLKNGEIKEVEVYSYPYVEQNGDKVLFSIVHDITARVAAENRAFISSMIIILLLILGLVGATIALILINKSKKTVAETNKQLKSLFDNMQEGFALHEIICDEKGKPMDYRFLEVNKAFEKITGLIGHKIYHKSVKEVLPGIEDSWITKYGEVALTGKPMTFLNYTQDVEKYFSVSVYSPKVNQFASIFIDISDQKKLEKVLNDEKVLFQTTLHALEDGVVSVDRYGKVSMMNSAASKLTGWTNEMAHGRSIHEIYLTYDEYTQMPCESTLIRVFETEESAFGEHQVLLKNQQGEVILIEENAAPIKDQEGRILGAVLVFRDFTEKRAKQNEIVYLSYHDHLTGLYNRRYLEDEMKRMDTERTLPISIVMLDVNGLKMTNDAFGHLAGDELLKRIASISKSVCREEDIIARIGGDEFVILLPMTSSDECQKIMERIELTVKEEKSETVVLSVSYGWATKTTTYESLKDVFVNAEESMYRHKLTHSQEMRHQTISLILDTFKMKNEREAQHFDLVSQISKQIGILLNLDEKMIKEIEIAGQLHDVGKISLTEAIFNYPRRLTSEEYEEVKRHPKNSYQLLKSVDAYAALSEIVLAHHERWDGQGYPRGLKGNEIPLIARILAIGDALSAMTSDRPYR